MSNKGASRVSGFSEVAHPLGGSKQFQSSRRAEVEFGSDPYSPLGVGTVPETPKPGNRDVTDSDRRLDVRSSTSAAVEWFVALLDAVGSGPVGKRLRQCPAHRDSAPSLKIDPGDDGRVLLHCHASCEWKAILKALKLPAAYLRTPPPITPQVYAASFAPTIEFPPVETGGGHPASRGLRPESIHDYGRARLLRYRHPVTGAKDVSWEAVNPHGEWVPGLLGTPVRDLPLYREPDVRRAVAAAEPVVLVESESSVDALRGLYATTWAGGAKVVPVDRIGAVLGSYPRLVVIPDNDGPGLHALARLRRAGLTPGVLVGWPGEDARDVHRRLGPEEFRAAVDRAAGLPVAANN